MKAKRVLLTCALALTMALCMVGFVACDGNPDKANEADKKYDAYRLYVAYAEDSGIEAQSYEEWLAGIAGHTPEITIDQDGYWCVDGIQTTTRAKGVDGKDGSVWYNGSGMPDAETGVTGDYYLNTATGDVYEKKETGGWTKGGNIKGADGTAGTPSGQGSGVNFYSGPGVPAEYAEDYASDAENGDYYIDTAARTLYQKKSNEWSVVVVFSITFRFGEGNPSGTANVGDLYLDTEGGKLYSYEFSSGWALKYTFSQATGGITERGTRVTFGTYPPEGSALSGSQPGDIHICTTTGTIYKYDKRGWGSEDCEWKEVPVDPSKEDLGDFSIKHVVGSHFEKNGHLFVEYSDGSDLDIGQLRPSDNVKVYSNDREIASAYIYPGENYQLPDAPSKDQMPANHVFRGWVVNNDEENLKQPGQEIEITGKTDIKAKTEEYLFDGLKGTYSLKKSNEEQISGSFTLDGFGNVTAASIPYYSNTLVATGTYEKANGEYGGVEYIMTLSGESGGSPVKSQIFGFSLSSSKELKSEWQSMGCYTGTTFTITTDSFEGIYSLSGYGGVDAGMVFVDGYGRIFGQYTANSTKYVLSGYYEPDADTSHGKPYIMHLENSGFVGFDFANLSMGADFTSGYGSQYMTSITMKKIGESVTYTLSADQSECGSVTIRYDGTVTGSVKSLNSHDYTVKAGEKLQKASAEYGGDYHFEVTIESSGVSDEKLVFDFLGMKFGAAWQSILSAGFSASKSGTLSQGE